MSATRPGIALLVALAGAACGNSADDSDQADASPPASGVACPAAAHVGSFAVIVNDEYTAVQGTVRNGVTPFLVAEVVSSDGLCQLLEPPSLFCDPACAPGTTCDSTGACIATPVAISVGAVTISGLNDPVEMDPGPPVYYYINSGTLTHPAFAEGDAIELAASGAGEVAPFALAGRGIAELVMPDTAVSIATDAPAQLSWTAPGPQGLATIHINLNIAQHGGTPGWIECEVADTGQFTIPVGLTNTLLSQSYSGFPAVALTRRSADSTTIAPGCVDFFVEATVTRAIEIPGLISCSGDDDCPDPLTCQGDLTCG